MHPQERGTEKNDRKDNMGSSGWVRVGASADAERAMKWVRRLAKAEGAAGDIPVMLLIGSFERVAGSLEEITRYLKDFSNCVVEHQGRSILCVADAAGQ